MVRFPVLKLLFFLVILYGRRLSKSVYLEVKFGVPLRLTITVHHKSALQRLQSIPLLFSKNKHSSIILRRDRFITASTTNYTIWWEYINHLFAGFTISDKIKNFLLIVRMLPSSSYPKASQNLVPFLFNLFVQQTRLFVFACWSRMSC